MIQIGKEKVLKINPGSSGYTVENNKNRYSVGKVVIAAEYSDLLRIKGFENYIIPHKKAQPENKGSSL